MSQMEFGRGRRTYPTVDVLSAEDASLFEGGV